MILAAMAPSSGQQSAPVPSPAEPESSNNRGVLILIRSTLLALAHANATGNYTVLHDLGGPSFQAVNSAARLSEIFSNLRAQRLDLSQLAVLEPQPTIPPQLDARGLLHVDGTYPSTMPQINFSLIFEPVAGQWRLFGISLNLVQPPPVSAPPPVTTNPGEPAAGAQPAPAARPASSKTGTAPPRR
jgi:hypothetical protein